MPFKLGAIWAAIKLDTSQFNAAIKQVQGQTKESAKGATKAGTAYGGMWKKLAMGVGIAGGVTLVTRTLVRQFSDMVKIGREFEAEWANVTTMMNSSNEEMRDMRDELIDLSPVLGSVTSLAAGMYQVLSASIPEDAAILFLESAAEAAVAGVTDTATAVDALTTVINAYGLEAGAVNSISDVMFETVKSGKLTYEELAASLGTVIPVAASTGIEFTEISGALAEMTKKGIPAQTATMQLRQVLMGILKPSKGAKDAMEELGLQYGEGALKAQGLAGWLVDLSEKTEGSADKMSSVIENARSLTGVLALAGTGTEGLTSAVKDMEGALNEGGQTAEAFDKQLSTMDITIETLKTATDKFKISFYLGFVEGVEKAIPSARDFDDIAKQLNADFRLLGETLGVGVVGAFHHFTEKIKDAQKWASIFSVTTKGFVIALKKGQLPTLKNIGKAYGDLAREEEDAAAWADSLAALMIKGADAMDKLTAEVIKENEELVKSDRIYEGLIPKIKDTKYEFIDWLRQVADGKMTIEEYNLRLSGMSDSFVALARDLKDADILDPKDLEPYFTELESAPSALASVLAGVGIQIEETHDSIAEHAKTLAEVTLPEFWQTFAQDVGYIYGGLIWDLMDKNSTFEESLKNFFDNWLNMFKSMITNMVQNFVTDFVGGILSGAQEAASGITSTLGEALGGDGAGDLAGGVSSITDALGGLAGTFNVVSGAITAIASVITALQGPGGPSSTDSWHFAETWKEQKRLTDYTMMEIGSSGGWLARIHDKTNAVVLKNEYQMRQNRKMVSSLKDIARNTAATVKALRSTKKAQVGAVSFQTELIQVHGTPQNPEYIGRHEDLARMVPGAGGGGTRNNYFSINVHDQIDPFTAQRIMRDMMLPQMIAALETKDYKRDLQTHLGIER